MVGWGCIVLYLVISVGVGACRFLGHKTEALKRNFINKYTYILLSYVLLGVNELCVGIFKYIRLCQYTFSKPTFRKPASHYIIIIYNKRQYDEVDRLFFVRLAAPHLQRGLVTVIIIVYGDNLLQYSDLLSQNIQLQTRGGYYWLANKYKGRISALLH